jgi:hypothetical protein
MPEHGDQHFVPNSYLKPWCNAATPAKQTDIYTVKAADGLRDLTLEHGLNQLETD